MKTTRKTLLLLGFLAGTGSLLATVNDQKAFLAKYPDAKAKLGKCTTCHTGAPKKGAAPLNAYGKDMMTTLADPKAAERKYDFAKIEAKDSDGDGKSNLDEIKAGTNPGDPASK